MKHKYLFILTSFFMLTTTGNAQVKANVEKADYPFELTTNANNPILYYIFSGRDSQGGTAPTYVFANETPWGDSVNRLQIVRQDPRIFHNQLWYFMEEGEGIKIISFEDNRMITVANTADAPKCTLMQTVEERTNDFYTWILDCANGCYAFKTSDGKSFLSHNGNWSSSQAQMGLYNADGSKDEGSRIFFEALPKENYPASIGHNAFANEKAQDAIYTITGTRISKITTSGIYIINGKKKLIK